MVDFFRPEVKYKIQNVDYGTFLERRGKFSLFLRAGKDDNKRQQWYFVKNQNGAYEIQNADDRSVCITSTLTQVTASKNSQNKYWKAPLVPGRPTHYLVNASPGVGDEDALLYATDGFSLSVTQDEGIEEIDRIMKNEEYRWKIVEVTPASLPDGDGEYRIRTLNGDAIHTINISGRKALSIQTQLRGDQRAWEIKSVGNGHCTIRNIKEQGYLTAERVKGKWAPGISQTLGEHTTWRIKPISDFTFGIFINLRLDLNDPMSETSMSLSVDEKTIILKPMKSAHNQLWCIEATDAPLTRPIDEEDDTSSTSFRGIEFGKDYLLRYGGLSGLYISVNMSQNSVSGGSSDDAGDITVERNPRSSGSADRQDVYLAYTLNGQKRYLVLNTQTNSVALNQTPYPWSIEEHSDQARHFYICDGNQTSRFLSGLAGRVGEQITATHSRSDTNSLWEFLPPA